jgi:hypothetical protein
MIFMNTLSAKHLSEIPQIKAQSLSYLTKNSAHQITPQE